MVKVSLKGKTPAQMRELADQLSKELITFKGEELEQAKQAIRHLRYHADKKESGGLNRAQQKAKATGQPIPEKAKPKAKAKAKAKADPKQFQLPGFVGMVPNPRVDEMARELILKALQESLDRQLANVVELFKKQA